MKGVGVAGSIGLAWLFNPVLLGINDRIIRPEYISKEEAEYIKERYPEYYLTVRNDRYFLVDDTKKVPLDKDWKEEINRKALYFYAEKNNKELETAKEIGGAVGTAAVVGWNAIKSSTTKSSSREIISRENSSKGPEYMKKDSVFINDGTPGGTVKLESQVVGNSNYELSKITNTYNGNTVVKVTNKVTGEIYSFKNFGNTQAGNSLSITNTNTSLVPFNPNASTGMSVTNLSSAGIIGGRVGSNLITSGKSVTTLEAPKNPVVKPVTKVEQNIETVKQPAVTSEKPKTVEKSHSQGSGNHNSNKESFNQKTEKNPNRNLAGENYGTEKTSNKMPQFSNRENIHRNSNTQNYDYKVQDNSGSNGSSNGGSSSKKNIEPSVEDSGKTYTLESQDANWNFKSEIPKTAVKNSEGNYTLGKNNEWNFDTKYNIPYTETGNKGQGLVSVPSYEALMNDYSRNYDIFHHSVGEVTTKPLLTSNYETYYRTISQEHYDILKNTGKMPAGYNGETFISPSSLYVQKYDYGGVTLEFKLNPGTTNELMNIGVKNRGGGIMLDSNYNYSKLPNAPKGWGNNHAMFKLETTIQKKPIIKDPYNVNIGLGREGGKALNIFNDNIIDYKVIGE